MYDACVGGRIEQIRELLRTLVTEYQPETASLTTPEATN
jgi:hypothetical protein